MTMQTIANEHRQVAADVIAPAAQLSTDSVAVLTGSEFDARTWKALSYNVSVATYGVKWGVYAANASDYSDEVAVQSLTNVAAAATGSYAVSPPPYSYYRVKIQSNVGGNAGTITLHGIAK